MNDHETVALQLSREPAPFRVAARCPAGRPSVIENERRRDMPTTFWITCPTLQAAISRVEATGGVRQAQAELGPEKIDETHAEHMRRYGTRVAGISNAGRIKCLHAFTALGLAGVIPNLVSRWTLDRLETTYPDPARCQECIGSLEQTD